MKKRSIQFMVTAWLLALPVLFSPGYTQAGDLSFLSLDNEEMISFDLSFKQYMASYKGMFVEKEKGLKSLTAAVNKIEVMAGKAETQGADAVTLGRLAVIKGLLLQAQGLALQDRFDEAAEISTPIRAEIYELHKALSMLTVEDHMIFFHNGVMHRAEPLISEGRYLELAMLIPFIEDALAKFKNPPKGATNVKLYSKRYEMLAKKVKAYTSLIKEMNNYVDPEYGNYMLSNKMEKAHTTMNKKFGALYLSFPKGMVWPKGQGPAPKTKK